MTHLINPKSFPFLEHPGPIPFAHRGGAGKFPENTMPAFQNAIDMGYKYLETDVHSSKDGEVFAFTMTRWNVSPVVSGKFLTTLQKKFLELKLMASLKSPLSLSS